MLKGKSNTPPSTTTSHSALPQGRLCGLGKGEEVKTERKKLFIRISKNHSVGYVGKGNKKIKKKKNPTPRHGYSNLCLEEALIIDKVC